MGIFICISILKLLNNTWLALPKTIASKKSFIFTPIFINQVIKSEIIFYPTSYSNKRKYLTFSYLFNFVIKFMKIINI